MDRLCKAGEVVKYSRCTGVEACRERGVGEIEVQLKSDGCKYGTKCMAWEGLEHWRMN